MSGHPLLLTGGGDWERFTFAGACNEPVPSNWRSACRRRAGHGGRHHYWSPMTGMGRGRQPRPTTDDDGVTHQMVWEWPAPHWAGDARMLHRSAYVAPATTDRLMVEAIRRREPRP